MTLVFWPSMRTYRPHLYIKQKPHFGIRSLTLRKMKLVLVAFIAIEALVLTAGAWTLQRKNSG